MLEERVRVAELLDIYGALLTERQQRILARYVLEDLSLGEIAEEEGISRQAVHDTVRRGSQSMQHYEAVLKLLENREVLKVGLKRILKDVSSSVELDREQGIKQLKELIK